MSGRARLLLCSWALVAAGCAGRAVHDAPAPIELADLDGGRWRPLEPIGDWRATVLIFVTTDCPIANAYAPEMAALREAFAAQRVRLFLVHVDPELAFESAREHAASYRLPAPILSDREHALVRATGARVTPEAVVVDASGRVVYRGRIDDAWADLGQRRRVVGRRDLYDAVHRLLAGQTIAAPWPPAVGCDIQGIDR